MMSDVCSKPPVVLTLAVLIALSLLLCRGLFVAEDPPVFVEESRASVFVSLGSGFSEPGVHQFIDGTTLEIVINMTHPGVSLPEQTLKAPLDDGEHLDLQVIDGKVTHFQRRWMTAGQRIALGIALHPDRMSRSDWQALPGIGEKLSERIENDRQKNGEFGNFERLQRVRGIGPKRIDAWRAFFLSS